VTAFHLQGLDPEYQLLVQCARLGLSDSNSERLASLLRRRLDWGRAILLAERHQLSSFLHHHLCSQNLENRVPASVRKSLKIAYEESRVRFAYYVEPELHRVLTKLAEKSIPVIPLKGAILNRLIYKDVALRSVGDLDLLFRESDLGRTYQILGSIGYRERETPPGHERSEEDYHFCPRLLSPGGAVEIEMHRHVVSKSSPLYFDIEAVWDLAVEREVAGVAIKAQSPQDLLTHLCLAFFLDRYHLNPGLFALRQLVDIAEVARFYSDDLDWKTLSAYWENTGLAGPIHLSLHTSQALLGQPEIPVDLTELVCKRPSDGLFEAFVISKVLADRPWFFHELVDPTDNKPWNITKAAARRLFPEQKYLELKYPRDAVRESAFGLYRRHLGDLADAAASAIREPNSFKKHLEVDRWMNRLQLGEWDSSELG